MEKERIDKWIWSVRIFKSRTQSTDACKSGKVKLNGNGVKPSTPVKLGDKVTVSKMGFDFSFLVKQVISKRVGAQIAALCYEDITPTEEINKYKLWYVGQSKFEIREKGVGRPTKKERREIQSFKEDDDIMNFWLDFEEETTQ